VDPVAGELADLYVVLSLQNAQLMAGLEESASAGEESAAKLTGSLDGTSTAAGGLAGTAERAAGSVGMLAESAGAASEAQQRLAESAAAAGEAVARAEESVAGSAKDASAAVMELREIVETSTEAEQKLADTATEAADAQQRLAGAARDSTGASEAAAAAADAEAAATERAAAAAGVYTDAQGRLRAANGRFVSSETEAGAALGATTKKTDESTTSAGAAASKFKLLGLAALVGGAIAVRMAGNFQQSMTRLVTSAGETQRNLALVSRGILQMSVATDTSTSQLAQGMYIIESAGFHGAAGLNVLKAAAQGAAAEGADLYTVSNAVTSGLNAYRMKASQAMEVTNMMVTAVGRGKMTMQDLAGSIAAVLPVASAAHISFAEVGAGIATMTAQGMSAQWAAEDLRHTITALQNPNNVQIAQMQQLGINSIELAKNIGRNGLTGTIYQLEEAILHHMGPSGLVLLHSLNQSKLAAQSAEEEIAAMPPGLQKLARAYLDGSISVQQWNAIMFKGSIPAEQKNLLQQFATTANAAHGFNAQLKAGGGDAQTFTAALAKVMGGQMGLQTALMVGGAHMATFKANVDAVAAAAAHTGQNVANWSLIQHNFNFQLGQAGKSAQAVGISFGQALLPAATAVMHGIAAFASMIARNAIACKALAVIVGIVLAGALTHGLVKALSTSVSGFHDLESGIKRIGGAVSDTVGWFRAGEDGVSGFSQAMGKAGGVAKSAWGSVQAAWSMAAGLFRGATVATEAQTAATELQTAATEGQEAATAAAATAQEGLDVAMDANPIGAIITLIMLLVGGFVLLWTHCKAFRDFWIGLWHDVLSIVDTVINWVRDHWKLLPAFLLGPLGILVTEILLHWHTIESIFQDAWGHIRGIVMPAVNFIATYIKGGLDLVVGTVKGAWDIVKGDFTASWDLLKGIVEGALSIIKDNITGTFDLIRGIFEVFVNLLEGHWSAAWHDITSTARELLGQLISIITTMTAGFGRLLWNAGVALVKGLIGGITSMFGAVGSAVGSLAHKVAGFFGLSPAIEGPLSGGGAPYIRGQHFAADFAAGMLSGQQAAAQAAARLAEITGGSPATSSRYAALAAAGGDGGYAGSLAATPGGGGSGPMVQVIINAPYGFIGSQQQLIAALQPVFQRAVLQYYQHNGSAGLTPAGR
jgi:phage-related protein